MKKFTVALSFVLGLCSISNTQAQIKVTSNGNVKMGGLASSTSTEYGLEIGYPKIRIHPVNRDVTTGTANDIYIYGECSKLIGGGGGPITLSAPDAPNAELTKCTAIIKGDNLQIGTKENPIVVYEKQPNIVNASGVAAISDRRYKNNIRNMESGLAEILQLQPVRFDYKQLNYNESPWDSLMRLNKVGFIAQDVAPIVPEAVNYDPFEDLYLLNQTDFIPYMVAGIQELNAIIQEQNETILELKSRIEFLEADNAAFATPTFSSVQPNGNAAETVAAIGNKLWSNVPNPFKQETRIRYALTEDVREAQL
ncbi:MAG: tail fiber domain-containing protein, partial [Bacteroidales bacterium]|nr:tail fiber domain-containing protein [Bacteroidales bacterium]